MPNKKVQSGDAVNYPDPSSRPNNMYTKTLQLSQMRLPHQQEEETIIALQEELNTRSVSSAKYESKITQQKAEIGHLRERLEAATQRMQDLSNENVALRAEVDNFQHGEGELEAERAANEQALIESDVARRKLDELKKRQEEVVAALSRWG